MTHLEVEATKFIEANGGRIYDAGEGRRFTTFSNGNTIKTPSARYLIQFGGIETVGHALEVAIITLHRQGKLDVFQFGFHSCPKCNGAGKVHHMVDNGTCWKCNGFGIIKN